MQTIKIRSDLYQDIVKYGIDIQSELETIVNNFLKKKTYRLSEEEIAKTVENSQRIEGYKPASKELESEVEAFMVKHNVQVSA